MFVSGDKPKTFSTQGKKTPHGEKTHNFFQGDASTYPLPLNWASMRKSEYEVYNIFENYLSHNDTKNTL